MPEDQLEVLERETIALERKVASITASRPLTPEERGHVTTLVANLRERTAVEYAKRQQPHEVISHGTPHAAGDARRGQIEARHRLEQTRGFRECRSDCPAAQTSPLVTGGVMVRCGIEKSKLRSDADPQSLLTFCMGTYQACPSWRAERQRILEGKPEIVKSEYA